jgi:hypothetical protein
MKRQIRITAGSVMALAELNSTKTADVVWQALPLSGNVNIWGEEIYFAIPVKIELEDGQEVVALGDLGYWSRGSAFCIFFGSTPISREGETRAASPVNIFGKLIDDPEVFKGVKEGERIVVDKT